MERTNHTHKDAIEVANHFTNAINDVLNIYYSSIALRGDGVEKAAVKLKIKQDIADIFSSTLKDQGLNLSVRYAYHEEASKSGYFFESNQEANHKSLQTIERRIKKQRDQLNNSITPSAEKMLLEKSLELLSKQAATLRGLTKIITPTHAEVTASNLRTAFNAIDTSIDQAVDKLFEDRKKAINKRDEKIDYKEPAFMSVKQACIIGLSVLASALIIGAAIAISILIPPALPIVLPITIPIAIVLPIATLSGSILHHDLKHDRQRDEAKKQGNAEYEQDLQTAETAFKQPQAIASTLHKASEIAMQHIQHTTPQDNSHVANLGERRSRASSSPDLPGKT